MGQRKGYKQTPEHIAKRREATLGRRHHSWKGDKASVRAGRSRAIRLYPAIGPCVICGSPRSERHHIDGNTVNNDPSNVLVCCRKCHMREDGRLEKFKALAIGNLPTARAASAQRRAGKTHCPKGHPYSGDNLYINPVSGCKTCRACLNEYKRNKRKLK